MPFKGFFSDGAFGPYYTSGCTWSTYFNINCPITGLNVVHATVHI